MFASFLSGSFTIHAKIWTVSAGLVCVGGAYMTGWDPRQQGDGSLQTHAFCVKYKEATADHDRHVWSMISANSAECDGPAQLLTGVMLRQFMRFPYDEISTSN